METGELLDDLLATHRRAVDAESRCDWETAAAEMLMLQRTLWRAASTVMDDLRWVCEKLEDRGCVSR